MLHKVRSAISMPDTVSLQNLLLSRVHHAPRTGRSMFPYGSPITELWRSEARRGSMACGGVRGDSWELEGEHGGGGYDRVLGQIPHREEWKAIP